MAVHLVRVARDTADGEVSDVIASGKESLSTIDEGCCVPLLKLDSQSKPCSQSVGWENAVLRRDRNGTKQQRHHLWELFEKLPGREWLSFYLILRFSGV